VIQTCYTISGFSPAQDVSWGHCELHSRETHAPALTGHQQSSRPTRRLVVRSRRTPKTHRHRIAVANSNSQDGRVTMKCRLPEYARLTPVARIRQIHYGRGHAIRVGQEMLEHPQWECPAVSGEEENCGATILIREANDKATLPRVLQLRAPK
jgi:hypothetical protein